MPRIFLALDRETKASTIGKTIHLESLRGQPLAEAVDPVLDGGLSGRRKVRIGDVASLAETSISTVSNYLNGRPNRMAPDTVARIERAIDQLQYRPSWAARQLKTGFVPVLGLLVPSVANPFHGALARRIEEAALRRGFQVIFGSSLRDPIRELKYAEEFWNFGIRGVIIGSSPLDLSHFSDLLARGLQIVAFDRSADATELDPPVDSVSMDNCAAGYLATRHLIELGHRKIGYVSAATPTSSRRDRYEGYRKALSEFGIAIEPSLVPSLPVTGGYDDTHGAELGRMITLHLLAAEPSVTGLVALNDMYALGACAAIRELGLTVPGDVSVASIDNVVLASFVDPPLTSVHHPIDALSVAAVDRLIDRLQGKVDLGPSHVTLAPEIIIRKSTARPSPRRRGRNSGRERALETSSAATRRGTS
jgi:DNA-binding LacI/PurR family transcriptional regulator